MKAKFLFLFMLFVSTFMIVSCNKKNQISESNSFEFADISAGWTEVFNLELENDNVIFEIFENDETGQAYFIDTSTSEVFLVACDIKEIAQLKKTAFECKRLVDNVDSRESYNKKRIYKKIIKNIKKFAPVCKEDFQDNDDYGFVKVTCCFTKAMFNESVLDSEVVISNPGELKVLSFTDQLSDIIGNYYKEYNPKVEFSYENTPSWEFKEKLEDSLCSAQNVPDVFTLEDSFIQEIIVNQNKNLMDLTDVYNELKAKLVKYPFEMATYNGKVYAVPIDICPGALFYRRSLAIKYLGTDDPEVIQQYLCDWEHFAETAETLGRNSNGKCLIVSSFEDLTRPILASRQKPWIVKKHLNIDPVMIELMQMQKDLIDKGYVGKCVQWSEQWFAGMKDYSYKESSYDYDNEDYYGYEDNYEYEEEYEDEYIDEYEDEYADESYEEEVEENHLEVFCYFMPSWGLNYVLKGNSPETSGDWAMIEGPAAYYWGGTWIACSKKSKNPKLVKDFIKYVCSNENFLKAWVEQSGSISVSNVVNDNIKDSFAHQYLANQNQYEPFVEIANKIDGTLLQKDDNLIQSIWAELFRSYLDNEITQDEFLEQFTSEVNSKLGL